VKTTACILGQKKRDLEWRDKGKGSTDGEKDTNGKRKKDQVTRKHEVEGKLFLSAKEERDPRIMW